MWEEEMHQNSERQSNWMPLSVPTDYTIQENKRFCNDLGIQFVDVDYDPENWYSRMKGMEYDPERGHRCTECFDMRMERAALYAHEHGLHAIATTNATSRWKDAQQVDDSGYRAAISSDLPSSCYSK